MALVVIHHRKRDDRIFPVRAARITNAIRVRVFGSSAESKPVRRTNILVIYIRAHLSLPRLVLLVCLIILIRVVSALACRGIEGRGLARAMLAMSGKGGML